MPGTTSPEPETDASPDGELTREEELERELAKGAGELPLNRPLGILGGRGLDLTKPDQTAPSLFGGITQEPDANVAWLAMLLAFLVFFPAAYVILWRSKHFSRRMRIGYTIGFTVVLAAIALAVYLGFLPGFR
ncbi:MAG TPA: hypothetical protein VF902_00880 [Coriobacteriia bacterium]